MTDGPRTYITPGTLTRGAAEWGVALQATMDSLVSTLDALSAAHTTARAEVATWCPGDPHLAQDQYGRFVLLDSLTAIANVQVALANIMSVIDPTTVPWGGGSTTQS